MMKLNEIYITKTLIITRVVIFKFDRKDSVEWTAVIK